MAQFHTVGMHLIDGFIKCTPKDIHVSPGDRVVWQASQPLLVFFPDTSPFEEGRGPFKHNETVTVKSKPPLEAGRYVPKVAVGGEVFPAEGDIIVT
jgi:hypothetical protein